MRSYSSIAGLHGVDHVLLRAVAADRGVDVFGGLVHRAERRQRIQHHADVGALQFLHREQRRRAEFGDVGQDRHLDRLRELLVHRQFGDRFREDHVGAGFDAGHRALDRRVQPFHRQRIGARHDDEVVIGAGIDRGLDAVDHFLLADDFLARTMAAALGADLVFDVDGGRAELDHRLDGARDVEGRSAEAGVDVDQQRQVADVGDAAHVGQHVVEVGDAEVGQAERAGGDAAAGQVDRLESRRAWPAARGWH